jgi:copper(I)-binding protein
MRSIKLALLLCLMSCAPALAHQSKHKGLVIHHPWVRALAAGETRSMGYVVITNSGKHADTLIAASIGQSGKGRIVTMADIGEVSPQCTHTSGVVIEPGQTITLSPGGLSIVFTDVPTTLIENTYVDGTLVFAEAGVLRVEFFVEPVDAQAPSHAPDCAEIGQ